MSQASEMVRTQFKENDDIRDAGLTTPEDIARYDDIVYGKDPVWQSLDVYRPKAAEGKKLPVIVSVHGGGWVYGDKERYQYYCMNLAQRGFAVVNFSYRLAPENKYPDPLEDANSVFIWLLDHAEQYGFDTEHVFAVGDSAGATDLGLYAAICTNPEYAAEYDFQPPKDFAPTAIALNCGAYHIDTSKQDLTTQLMDDFLPEKGSEREIYLIGVANHVTGNYPPCFVMTCTDDFLKYQAPVMVEKLILENVPFEMHYYGDKKNLLPHVFHCDVKSQDAKVCNNETCEFFRKFLS